MEFQETVYKLIYGILLIDKSNNFEYFCHKYKTSNSIKNRLNAQPHSLLGREKMIKSHDDQTKKSKTAAVGYNKPLAGKHDLCISEKAHRYRKDQKAKGYTEST